LWLGIKKLGAALPRPSASGLCYILPIAFLAGGFTVNYKLVSALLILLAVAICVQFPDPQAQSTEPALPYTPSLDVNSMDRTVNPCDDFYTYSCGRWMKNNPIPADQSSWSVYGKLYQDNLIYLRGILEQAETAHNRDTVTQEIGDYYAACVDENAIEKLGATPIQGELAGIAALGNVKDLAATAATLRLDGDSMLFGSGATQDPDDSDKEIMEIAQGGLGLPDRDYYTKDDRKSKEIRDHYLDHIQNDFVLIGETPEAAKKDAATVMRIETNMAKASLTRVERRDPHKLVHKMTVADLNKIAPGFDWNAFFTVSAVPHFDILNVEEPEFFKDFNASLASVALDDWKAYLRFHVVNSKAPLLSSAFVNENFDFFNKYLRGAKEIQPRWRRCVQYVDRQLPDALGQAYVRRTFSPELKAATIDMAHRIEDAMAMRIQLLAWMSPETKQQALLKLQSIRNKVGYPDHWRDYSSIVIKPSDFFGNYVRATQFEAHRQLNKVGKPVDRTEWGMSPPTVNAYYSPEMNDINFPAGVLQPPLYDAKEDAAPNYGNTGSTVGHELTHAFDDEGRQFDAKGNLKDWWTKKDADAFNERAKCVTDQYAQYVVVDDIHINSKLTEGEDIADFGGTILAYVAWKDATKTLHLVDADGLTPDQRFFVGFAQWACENERPENLRANATTDPHSPGKYRINGVVVNMPEFAQAFSCKQGDAMVKPPAKVCSIW
jgi:putative endopeptidase